MQQQQLRVDARQAHAPWAVGSLGEVGVFTIALFLIAGALAA
jgi:hypothetical protein